MTVMLTSLVLFSIQDDTTNHNVQNYLAENFLSLRTSWINGQHPHFVHWKFHVQSSARKPIILSDVVHDFPQPFMEALSQSLQTVHNQVFQHNYQFIFLNHRNILCCKIYTADKVLKINQQKVVICSMMDYNFGWFLFNSVSAMVLLYFLASFIFCNEFNTYT